MTKTRKIRGEPQQMYVLGTTASLLLQGPPVMLPWPVRKVKGAEAEALFVIKEACAIVPCF